MQNTIYEILIGFINSVVNTLTVCLTGLCLLIIRPKQDYINSGTTRISSIISGHRCKEPEIVASFHKNLSKE